MKKAFIGDVGAGNMLFYSVVADAEIPKPKPLNDPNGEPSGYAVDADGNWILGLGLYNANYAYAMDSWTFRINIKAAPNDDNEAEQTAYAKAWLNRLKERYPEEFDGCDEIYWMIGCPTGNEWKKDETRERYRKIFENAGFENVIIVPESNAAMAYYQKTTGALDQASPQKGVLLYDTGAYSMDVTRYTDGKIFSTGCYLGASLIERMIVRTVLTQPESKYRAAKVDNWHPVYNPDPALTAGVKALYEQRDRAGENFRAYLLLKARQLKEQYFNQLRTGYIAPNRDIYMQVSISDHADDPPFVLFVSQKMMEDILENLSVHQVLSEEFDTLPQEVRSCLGEFSWLACLRKFLDQVDRELFEEGEEAKNAAPAILLTGGGSMMSCVEKTVKEHYPKALVFKDYDAVSAIGLGMGYWAPDKIRAEQFETSFKELLDRTYIDEDGDEQPVLVHSLAQSLQSTVTNIATSLIRIEQDALADGFTEWVNYRCEADEIPDRIKEKLQEWNRDQVQESALMDTLDKEIENQADQINQEFSKILEKAGLKTQQLIDPKDKSYLSICRKLVPVIFASLVEVIIQHYEEIWKTEEFRGTFPEVFKNPSRGLLLDKRRSVISIYAETLDAYADAEKKSTAESVYNAFYETDYLKNAEEETDYPATFSYMFIMEAGLGMIERMKSQKKEFLNKLVLEEYLEE